ncbi:MAG: hypothetical protein ACO23H_11110 [Alphaproteobacteria bacterium]
MASDTVVQYILKVDSKGAEKGLEGVAKDADRAAKELDQLDESTKKSNRQLDNNEKSTKKASKGLRGLKVAGAAAGAAIGGLAVVATGTIATIGALATAYLSAQKAAFDFSREVVDSVNQLNDLSAQSGLSANSIQAVITAFEGSGQSAQAAEAFVGRFPRLFADLSAGAGRASEAAAKLGVSLTDASGATKSADQVLIDVTRGLQSIEDPTERATQGFLLLGRSAGQFLQAFGATSDFENFLELSNLFGVKTGPEASAAAARFQEQLAFVDLAVKGLRQQFVDALGGIDFFNERLLDGIKVLATLGDFITENEALFQQLGSQLAQTGSGVLQFLQSLLGPFAQFVNASFKVVNDQIITIARGLKELGVIGNETFYAFAEGARSAESAVTTFSELATRLGDVDFGGSGVGVGGRQSAARAEELIGTILAGVSQSVKDSRPQVDDLASSVENLGDKSKDTVSEIDKDADDAFKSILKITESFEDIDPSVRRARDVVNNLKLDIFALEIAQRDTTFANNLLAEAETRLAQAREDAAARAEAQAKRERQERQLGAVDAFSTVASLDVAGIASLINPVAGAITGALIELGSKTPEQIKEEALAQAEALANGLAILPALFLEILPQLTVAIAEAVYDGIINLVINLVEIIKDRFNLLTSFRDRDPNGNNATRDAFMQGLRDFFDPSKSASYAAGGRFLPKAQGGIRFTGNQDGLAMLHRGEFVVPQSGQRPQQVDRQMQGMGGGLTVNINSAVVDRNAVDALVRQIEVRFNNQFGTSSSNLFGGR